METVSNVTVSVLTSGITMATVGTLLGVISTAAEESAEERDSDDKAGHF